MKFIWEVIEIMDEPQQKIIRGLILWAVVIVGLYFGNRKRNLSGLTYIWLGDLAINHLFGSLIYLVPNYVPQAKYLIIFTAEHTAEGFWQTSLGLLGFLTGAIFIGPMVLKFMRRDTIKLQKESFLYLPMKLIAYGVFLYFILRFLPKIPSLGTLSQGGWMLIQVGICLGARNAYFQNNKKDFILWMLVGMVIFPLFTLISWGFLGFGIKVALIVLCFTSAYYRDKWKLIILCPFILWLGLCVFVNYAAMREDLRAAVWGGGTLDSRISVIKKAFAEPVGLNINNVDQLDLINMRLNQNCFVGLGVEYLAGGGNEFARGKTLWTAVIAMIPRILWKNKPAIGGSGSLIEDYTGFEVAEGTSFGVGLPLEFYANFGTVGVIVGFLIIGALIAVYDRKAGNALVRNDMKDFVLFFLPGLAFTSTLCSLAEATSSFAAMYVFLFIMKSFLFKSNPKPKRRISNYDRVDQQV